MRNRIVVAVSGAQHAALVAGLQAYAITQRVARPEELWARLDPARTAAAIVDEEWDPSGGLVALLTQLRARCPLLPLMALLDVRATGTLRALTALDVECQPAPLTPPVLHRFAQRALSFGALPDDAVAHWVSQLAVARGLSPTETQLLCMALADESRARMRHVLGVTENTLKTYVRGLLRKTNERSLDGLAKNVLRVALLEARPGTRDVYRAPWMPGERRTVAA